MPRLAKIAEAITEVVARLDVATEIPLAQLHLALLIHEPPAPVEAAALLECTDQPRFGVAKLIPFCDREEECRLHQVFGILGWDAVAMQHPPKAGAQALVELRQRIANRRARALRRQRFRSLLRAGDAGRRLRIPLPAKH